MSEVLWTPDQSTIENSAMKHFMDEVNDKYGLKLESYQDLWKWSVDHLEDFWDTAWKFFNIKTSVPYTKVAENLDQFPGTVWFPGAKLNYAENMLEKGWDPEQTVLIFRGENSIRKEYTRAQLIAEVQQAANALRLEGVGPGSFVAAYMPNIPETIIAMLASAAVGAAFCSCATDIGPKAAADRLGQVEPTVLFTADGYYYKGKTFETLENAAKVAAAIPSIKKVIVAHYAGKEGDLGGMDNAVSFEEFKVKRDEPFVYEQMDASAPLVVMFSSGTTGKPKCMVQSAGGLLANQLKELILHTGMSEQERMLYITACSWMMWNWMLSALGTGGSLVLYDGNPSWPDDGSIWRILEEEGVTIFGLSASYIHSLMKKGFIPKDAADLSKLKAISQTASALSEEGFDFVYENIKPDVHLQSIAGGTDINGCFNIGNPLSPVYKGELQGPALAMDVCAFNEKGEPVVDEQGELVCRQPAPSMPLYFWNDPGNERYLNAYFRDFPGVWRHGDYVVYHSDSGGATYYGRSDSILKPSGVRIGTAEIYNQVEKIDEIDDSIAIGQTVNNEQRIVLFVKMKEGEPFTDETQQKIRSILRKNASPRHVPALIVEAPDLPRTLNGKKVESSVTNILSGRKVTNRDSLENPECLDFFEAWAANPANQK